MCQNYQMSVSGKNIRIFNKVAMVIVEIKKAQFWCGKAFGRRLMTWWIYCSELASYYYSRIL